MGKFKLPVCWELSSIIEIEADSLKEAIEKFDANNDYIPLPNNGEYTEGSFGLSDRDIEYLELFQE